LFVIGIYFKRLKDFFATETHGSDTEKNILQNCFSCPRFVSGQGGKCELATVSCFLRLTKSQKVYRYISKGNVDGGRNV